MNRFARFAVAAAAVVVVAVVAYSLLPSRGGTGGLLVSPSPTPLVSPTPVPPLPSGSMSAGTYSVTDATLTLVPYTVTVPAGWARAGATESITKVSRRRMCRHPRIMGAPSDVCVG